MPRMKKLKNNTRIVEHLRKHSDTAKTLGLFKVLDRTTVGRWWRRYLDVLEETIKKISVYASTSDTDHFSNCCSTPLVDLYFIEVEGVTQAMENSEISSFTQPLTIFEYLCGQLLHQVTVMIPVSFRSHWWFGGRLRFNWCWLRLENKQTSLASDAKPIIALNPQRRKRKKIKYSRILKTKNHVAEQFIGLLKANVLKQCWIRLKGLVKKTAKVILDK